MKVIFLDNDGVICLSNNWGSRFKKQRKVYTKANPRPFSNEIPVNLRFDNFDSKAIKVLNKILTKSGAEIVVSSDWKKFATLEELGQYYTDQGIIKKPIGFTKLFDECEQPEDFPWYKPLISEQCRSLEILQYLKDHPEITHWVVIDDLHMGTYVEHSTYGPFERDWGLSNFVWTPRGDEGIKQSGIKDEILKFLI